MRSDHGRWPARVGLLAAIVVSSAPTVQKYAGSLGVVGYLVVVAGIGASALGAMGVLDGRISNLVCIAGGVCVFLAVLMLFAAVYPHANSHLSTAGSDRDDAADLGAHALLHGRYPYAALTYLGNPVSQLPGGLLAAVPFVALGHSAYAFAVWFPALAAVLYALSRDAWVVVASICLVLVLAPVVIREIVTGGDLFANTVAVVCAAYLVASARAPGTAVVAALALGIVLSWRLNLVFVIPPLLACVRYRHGINAALIAAVVVGGAFLAVTLPFYLPHRHGFPPFRENDKLIGFEGVVPGGPWLVVGIGAAASVILAVRGRAGSIEGIFRQTAWIQGFFVIVVAGLASERARSLDLSTLVAGYGLPVLLFALVGVVGTVGTVGARQPVRAR